MAICRSLMEETVWRQVEAKGREKASLGPKETEFVLD